jgi:hypothetical protein
LEEVIEKEKTTVETVVGFEIGYEEQKRRWIAQAGSQI